MVVRGVCHEARVVNGFSMAYSLKLKRVTPFGAFEVLAHNGIHVAGPSVENRQFKMNWKQG